MRAGARRAGAGTLAARRLTKCVTYLHDGAAAADLQNLASAHLTVS
jgi:hypothetical protein